MTETEVYLLEKVKSLGVTLRFKSWVERMIDRFFQEKNTSWISEQGLIEWKNPPILSCEPNDTGLAQFILKRIKPNRKEWKVIRKHKRIVGTTTIERPKLRKIENPDYIPFKPTIISRDNEYRYL